MVTTISLAVMFMSGIAFSIWMAKFDNLKVR